MKRYQLVVASACFVVLLGVLTVVRLGYTQDGPGPKGKKGPPVVGRPGDRPPLEEPAFGQETPDQLGFDDGFGEAGPRPRPPHGPGHGPGKGPKGPPHRPPHDPMSLSPASPHGPPPPLEGPHRGPHGGPHLPPHLREMETSDPQLFALLEKDVELEKQTHVLADEIRRLSPAERAKRETELKALLSEHFEVRQQRRALQIERMADQIKGLRDSLDKRNAAREAIIDKRLGELLGTPQDLEF